MSDAPAETPSEESKQSKKPSRAPLLVGLGGSLLVLALALFTYVRGGVAETEERNPTSPDDGIVCQLYDDGEGRRPTRCAIIVRASVAEVSAAVRDYERFAETFDSNLGSIDLSTIEHEDETHVHLEGLVSTRLLGSWPIDVRIEHTDTEDDRHTASWQESEGSGTFNRGRWVISPAPGGALLAYEIEVQVAWAPTFLVNTVLLTQLSYPLRKVADRVEGA